MPCEDEESLSQLEEQEQELINANRVLQSWKLADTGDIRGFLHFRLADTGDIRGFLHFRLADTGDIQGFLHFRLADTGDIQGFLHFRLADTGDIRGFLHFRLADRDDIQGFLHFSLADTVDIRGFLHFRLADTGDIRGFLYFRLADTGDIQGFLQLIDGYTKWTEARRKTFHHFVEAHPGTVSQIDGNTLHIASKKGTVVLGWGVKIQGRSTVVPEIHLCLDIHAPVSKDNKNFIEDADEKFQLMLNELGIEKSIRCLVEVA
ncbi:CENPP-like protein [Mya arenaria]|uniref:CENPP-like protein n=1 Tax=Mya arenaria TaxID=6604 RepID=A0ABY7FY84_MYAAR|nr:CENPP-like protein [Mya arenaria]